MESDSMVCLYISAGSGGGRRLTQNKSQTLKVLGHKKHDGIFLWHLVPHI